MNNADTRSFDMFTRLRDFKATRAGEFLANSLEGRLFALIEGAIETLIVQRVAQSSGLHAAQQSSEGKAAIHDALRKQLQMIARTARGMAINTPGLADKFRVPRSKAEQVMLNAARTIRVDAEPLQAGFIERKMPEDFLDTLDGLIAAYEQKLVARHQGTTAHVAARAAIRAEIKSAMKAARELDPIVRNKYRDDPATLAAWESARHIEKTARKPKKPSGPTSPSDKP